VRRWLTDNRNPASFSAKLRGQRWKLFLKTCAPDPARPLLDVGGVPGDTFSRLWTGATIWVNLDRRALAGARAGRAVVADGRRLPFRDGAFDVVFSNSLIEHVGDRQEQWRLAEEVRRVGKRYFVQTPNRAFPIEPHYLLPFFQFLPERLQRVVHFLLPIGWVPRGRYERVWMLTPPELQQLFPDAHIVRERLLGLPKSCCAIRTNTAADATAEPSALTRSH
jgi:SAM-dependent methyltransferase